MEAERWQKVKGLFDVALEIPSAKREEFLNNACTGDDELRHDVENLLASKEFRIFIKRLRLTRTTRSPTPDSPPRM